MVAVAVITVIVLVVVLVLSQIKSKPKKSAWDKLTENPVYQQNKALFEEMEKLCEQGTDKDVMPDGYGEFGHEPTNPIPTKMPMGSIAYLGRLRTLDGVKVKYHRIGSTGAPNIDQIIDQYEVTANGRKVATLFLCPYNKKNSDRPPKGFTLAPLPWA